MAVPFNLYSLGYFLKRFIEHYPKLNCIYYPLTQLLKWLHIHLIFIIHPLVVCFSSPFSVSHTGVYSVLKSLPSQTALLEQNDRHPYPQVSIWILVTSTIQFYKNSCRACFVTGLSEDLFVPFVLRSEFAWQKSLMGVGGGGVLLSSGSCQPIFLTPISTPLGSSQLFSGSSANMQQVHRLCLCVRVLVTSNSRGQHISPGVPLH